MFRRAHPADHLLLLRPGDSLLPDECARVDAHLAGCPRCRGRQAWLQQACGPRQPEPLVPEDAVSACHVAARARLQATLRDAGLPTAPTMSTHATRLWRVAGSPLALAATALAAILALQLPWAMPMRGDVADAGRHARPVPVFTPGAVSALTASALCAGERPSRLVSADVRDQVLVEYGMQWTPGDAYELDALITPELGGTTARANLWPQRYDAVWNARVKDGLESLLAARVCAGTMPLRDAQNALALDWVDAYKRFFDTRTPLPSHLASIDVDDELTLLGPAQRPVSTRAGTMGRLFFVVRFGEPAPPPRRQPGRLDVRVTAASADESPLRQS